MILMHEIKISLPFYKIAYAIFFTMMLSLVRGVIYSYEIGIASEPLMAILAAAFCADTYTREISSRRSEILRLYPMKKRISSIYKRMLIQELFLLSMAAIGYGLFYVFQNPVPMEATGSAEIEIHQFLIYFASAAVSLSFWGLLSNLLSCLFQNMWPGIGGCLMLWLFANSSLGDRYFGPWNLFSYAFRSIENSDDVSWIYGKIVCILISALIIAAMPKIIQKRGAYYGNENRRFNCHFQK